MSLVGKTVGNYQIQSKLGEGGMGAVYLGAHPLIGKKVAVKVLLDELSSKEDIVQRFFQEAKAVNDIGHQNIVDIIDFGKMRDGHQEVVYFIMEFLEGESLSDRIRRQGLAINEVLHVMEQACSALAASHAKGIVHRDLKPENIHLIRRGQDPLFVKLLDFGIAKLTGDGPAGSQKTRTGMIIGTPTYMSPEQCEGKGQLDARSDVYSLGIVMYELLCGRTPFIGEGFGEILIQHMAKMPQPPSELNRTVPPEIEAIVMHALEKDRNARFQTMDEFLAAIRDPAQHYLSWRPADGVSPSGGRYSSVMPTVMSPSAASGQRTGQRTGERQPTTLSGAASEMGGRSSGRSRAPIFAIVGLLAAGGIGVGIWKLASKPSADAAVTNPDKPTPKTEDENVHITIRSDPAGAVVVRGGSDQQLTTPATLDVKRGSATFDIIVKKAGYKQTILREISTDRDATLVASLEAVPSPQAPAAPPAAPHGADKPKSSHSSSSSSHSRPHTPAAPAKVNTEDDGKLLPVKIKW